MIKLIATTLIETERLIIDADVSAQMTAVLLKGKGERIVAINDEDAFSVSPHMTMLRIIGSQLVLYDGQELHFYTVEGACTQSVNVGQHVRHIEPMKDQVIVTYTDQGVYDDPIGKEIVNVVSTDGTKTSQRAFAEQHMLQYDIPIAKGKPYACLSTVHHEILHFNEQFEVVNVQACLFDTGNVLAMNHQYPYYLIVEENRFICLQEDGSFEVFKQPFSYGVRSVMHKGVTKFIEIFEHRVIGYHLE